MFARNLIVPAVVLIVAPLSNAGSAYASNPPASVHLPASWYQLPEYAPQVAPATRMQFLSGQVTDVPTADASANLDRLFQANLKALSKLDPSSSGNLSTQGGQGDLVPWHIEYFVNDLAVSMQGTIGLLVTKGTATVQTFWRQKASQVPAVQLSGFPTAVSGSTSAGTLEITDATVPGDLSKSIEPLVRAIMSTGNVSDETALRKNLFDTAQRLQATALGLPDNPGYHWWLSRLRLDLFVDGSGKVNPATTVGGQVQARMEWFRLKQASGGAAKTKVTASVAIQKSGFSEFVKSMAEDLEVLSPDVLANTGFKVYQIRVGAGVTVKGTVGIASGDVGFMAQCYFTNDAPKPKKYEFVSAPIKTTVALIGSNTQTTRQRFAQTNRISFAEEPSTDGSGPDPVVYEVDRGQLREGLKKAENMASFFASRAGDPSNANDSWKLFELRTLFDFSVSGTLGLATIAGTPSLELDLYNENF